jgi:hypothetical protein
MGCLESKVDDSEVTLSKLKKDEYIEYVEDIETIRHAAWNSLMACRHALNSAQTPSSSCASLAHGKKSVILPVGEKFVPKHIWKIDTIQKEWDMTIKSWCSTSFANSSITLRETGLHLANKRIDTIDADEYFDKRVKDARQMIEIKEGIKMPHEDFLLSDNEQKLCLSLTLAIPSYEAEFIKKYPMHISEVCMSVFFVAAEQKDEEARLIYGQGFTTINQFKKSINMNA